MHLEAHGLAHVHHVYVYDLADTGFIKIKLLLYVKSYCRTVCLNESLVRKSCLTYSFVEKFSTDCESKNRDKAVRSQSFLTVYPKVANELVLSIELTRSEDEFKLTVTKTNDYLNGLYQLYSIVFSLFLSITKSIISRTIHSHHYYFFFVFLPLLGL